MVIVGLLTVGVGLALDAYAERQANRNRIDQSLPNIQNQPTRYETDPDANRKQREEEAFNELQNYADFQNALSSKVLDELTQEETSMDYEFPLFAQDNTGRQHVSPHPDHSESPRRLHRGQLSCPVVISQRNPDDGTGLWIRAYASSLMDCGIEQQTFLSFLDAFNEHVKLSPYLQAVNIAGLVSGIGWRDAPINLSATIPTAVRLAKAEQMENNTNSFLAHANASLFYPRGLFAMVITSLPDVLSQIVTVNPLTKIQQDSSMDRWDVTLNSTFIYPEPEPLPKRRTNNKLSQMNSFILEYGDQIPRAKRSTSSQSSSLPAPQATQFSKFSERAANASPFLSLISTIAKDRDKKRDYNKRRRKRGSNLRGPSRPNYFLENTSEGTFMNGGGEGKSSLAGAKREGINGSEMESSVEDFNIHSGALYLVIVNDPTEYDGYTGATPNFNPTIDSDVDFMTRKGKQRELNRGDTQVNWMAQTQSNIPSYGHGMGDSRGAPPAYSPKEPQEYYSESHEQEYHGPIL